MAHQHTEAPDSTAVRVALWRAMHVQVDPPPHVLVDEIGLQLVAPDDGWRQLAAASFDSGQPAVVVSTGVTMYLTRDATAATLRQIAGLAPGSTLAMTFLLPTELVDEADRPGLQAAERGARAAGTPFVSFYTPQEMLEYAHAAGFKAAQHVSGTLLARRYFADRTDSLCPSSGEDLLVATT
jgi:O-methyltransferase involved in polyketide biosynthesis